MADEIQLQFITYGTPDQALFRWKSEPPAALRDGDYELVDESYNSLTYEARYLDWPAKLFYITIVGYFMRKLQESIFQVTVRFDASDDGRTKVTLLGHAHPDTRAALGQLAAEHGGAIGLQVGV
jgi:hypothetical protein